MWRQHMFQNRVSGVSSDQLGRRRQRNGLGAAYTVPADRVPVST
jgi:hypothetical protein